MKFKEYLTELNEMAKEYPESLKMKIIYSNDDEGNAFQEVISMPVICRVEDFKQRYVEVEGYLSDTTNALEGEYAIKKCNAILIN